MSTTTFHQHGSQTLDNKEKLSRHPKSFEFITISDPTESRRAETRTLVRKHAMRDVVEKSRSIALTKRQHAQQLLPPHVGGLRYLAPRPPHSESQLSKSTKSSINVAHEIHPSSASSSATGEDNRRNNGQSTGISTKNPRLVTYLGAGRVDPFANYPAEPADSDMNEAIDYFHTGTHPYRLPKDVWFVIGLTDPAAFYQLLSTAVATRAHLKQEKADMLAIKYRVRAIRSVNERLSNPKVAVTEGMIGAIMAFLCYNIFKYKLHQFDSWLRDMNGLQNIIRMRGGINTLNHNAVLRILLTWTDLMGSAAMDHSPRLPFPVELVPASVAKSYNWQPGHLQISLLFELKKAFTQKSLIIDIFQSLSMLNASMRERFGDDQIWLDEVYFAVEVNAVFHRLMSAPRLRDPSSIADVVQETCRIAGIIYIGKLFEAANVGPWFHGPHVTRIKAKLEQCDINWAQFNPIKLWVLSMAMTGSAAGFERDWIESQVRNLCKDMKLSSWLDIATFLFRLPWMHGFIRDELMELYNCILAE